MKNNFIIELELKHIKIDYQNKSKTEKISKVFNQSMNWKIKQMKNYFWIQLLVSLKQKQKLLLSEVTVL